MPFKRLELVLLLLLAGCAAATEAEAPFHIMLVNDDGISSPGLAAVAEVLEDIGSDGDGEVTLSEVAGRLEDPPARCRTAAAALALGRTPGWRARGWRDQDAGQQHCARVGRG